MPGFSRLSFPNAGKTFVILAALNLPLSHGLRKAIFPHSGALRCRPENIQAVNLWTSSWIILLSMHRKFRSGTVFGLAFHIGGKTLQDRLRLSDFAPRSGG